MIAGLANCYYDNFVSNGFLNCLLKEDAVVVLFIYLKSNFTTQTYIPGIMSFALCATIVNFNSMPNTLAIVVCCISALVILLVTVVIIRQPQSNSECSFKVR